MWLKSDDFPFDDSFIRYYTYEHAQYSLLPGGNSLLFPSVESVAYECFAV